MRKSAAAALLFSVLTATGAISATKDVEKPDPEILKMMEFLREMEMIKQIDLLQDMHRVESAGAEARATPRKTLPGKQKETVK